MSWGGDRPTKMALLDIFPHVNLATIISWLVCWEKKAGRVVLRGTPIEREKKKRIDIASLILSRSLPRT